MIYMKENIFRNIILLTIIFVTLTSTNVLFAENNENSLNVCDNYTQALDNAKLENRNIILIFDQESCSWCEIFKKNTLENDDVIEKLNSNYITTIVDINKNPEIASKYSVYGTPTVVILNSEANEIYRNEGYLPPDEFLKNIEEI